MGLMFLGAATASAIGGALSYFGSWRLVYAIYGVGELILSVIMFKILERDKPVVEKLNFVKAYKEPLWNCKNFFEYIFYHSYCWYRCSILYCGFGNEKKQSNKGGG
ncbi:hypothetical protein RZO55_21700 [Clostridium boliviensis]|uniref:MFS transporter n=1 Tax=Clostridium boliviensis TaxID=318465 RepID=A0ABU4GT82_9CLOT|nr:hypothetical protein [Clostridium boliviensis]MDW2800190.1 hypothetical protein [Clostridium boliviensis]